MDISKIVEHLTICVLIPTHAHSLLISLSLSLSLVKPRKIHYIWFALIVCAAWRSIIIFLSFVTLNLVCSKRFSFGYRFLAFRLDGRWPTQVDPFPCYQSSSQYAIPFCFFISGRGKKEMNISEMKNRRKFLPKEKPTKGLESTAKCKSRFERFWAIIM